MRKALIVLFLFLVVSFGVTGYMQSISTEDEVEVEADKGTEKLN
ncbi:hypothetical protein [Sediminibacillus massiliensis]|nr:hypothetical protein [Sediminibacillus massiliensis]